MTTTMTIDQLMQMMEKVKEKVGNGDVPVYFEGDSEISAARLMFEYEDDNEQVLLSLY